MALWGNKRNIFEAAAIGAPVNAPPALHHTAQTYGEATYVDGVPAAALPQLRTPAK